MLQIQKKKLISDGYKESKSSIITTYLNKGAIQSSLNKHDKAIQSLNKALSYIQQLQNECNSSPKKESEKVADN